MGRANRSGGLAPQEARGNDQDHEAESSFRRNLSIPFHDRFYIWGSAGLNVGTSPSGLKGLRAFRIDELTLAEIKAVRELFAKWWVDPQTGLL